MKHGHKANHHGKHKAGGGRTEMKVSGNPDVFKEAEGKESYDRGDEKKHGGKVKHKRAAGGKVGAAPVKTIGLMTGGGVRPRLDRPGRKRGGAVGADRSPLSSAHRGGSGAPEMPKEQEGGRSD